jgi:hypothetical protein
MGVAPGLKTEFWLFAASDFCKDLKNWTDTIIAQDDAPLVHSVSYGWQENLSQIGCQSAEVAAIDANFAKLAAKLAAKGATMIFASGDSGSGYAPTTRECASTDYHEGVMLEGSFELHRIDSSEDCCSLALLCGSAGYSFVPPSPDPTPGVQCSQEHPGTRS